MTRLSLCLLVAGVCATGASAQAAPRADLPRAGTIRVTFDPIVSFWDQEFRNGVRGPLGAFLSGDSVRGAQIPQLARLDQDIAIATGASGFVANLGAALLSLRAERRVTPLLLELGISNRLSLGVRVPLVRVQTRAGLTLDSTNSNLGRNPRNLPGADSSYGAFFQDFDDAVNQLVLNIASGSYGCPLSPQCDAARAFADTASAVRDALLRAAFGAGPGDAAPFLPTAGSTAGVAIGANVTRLQQQFATTWSIAGFSAQFLLPTLRAVPGDVQAMVFDTSPGYGFAALQGTRRALRFWLGDVEVAARYQLVRTAGYTATIGALARLPTGHQESPHDLLDLAAGDGQLDLEGELTQELTLGGRLWVNAALRVGVQQAGERDRRVGPGAAIFVPRGATARLAWDPGDYAIIDVAPLYRFSPHFAAGLTFGWSAQGEDRYTYRTVQDSTTVEGATGTPVPASVLNAGTAIRQARVGGAVTFTGPVVEGSFVVERVVSGRGGPTPALTSFRIVLRTSRRLF